MDKETARRAEKMKVYSDVGKIRVTIGNRTYFIDEVEYNNFEKFRKRRKK